MSDSTDWHKHKDGIWHRRGDNADKDNVHDFYDTSLGEPFRSKSMLKSEAGGKGRPGGRCL